MTERASGRGQARRRSHYLAAVDVRVCASASELRPQPPSSAIAFIIIIAQLLHLVPARSLSQFSRRSRVSERHSGGGKSKGEISPGDCCACPPPRPRRRWRRTRTRTLEGRTPRWGWWHSSFPSGGGRGMKSNPLCPRGRSALPTGRRVWLYGSIVGVSPPAVAPQFRPSISCISNFETAHLERAPLQPCLLCLLSGYWGRGRDGRREERRSCCARVSAYVLGV